MKRSAQHRSLRAIFCPSCRVRFCYFIQFNCDVALRHRLMINVVSVYSRFYTYGELPCEQALLGALAAGRKKRQESLQLRLWNLNAASNSPVAPPRMSCQICANQREAETSANVCTNIEKHFHQSAFPIDFFDADIQIP